MVILIGKKWVDETMEEWSENDYRIFVGNLGNEVTENHLQSIFGRYQSLLKTKVVRDNRTGKSKGFGFVSFGNSNDYIKAFKDLNGKYVGKKPIRLSKSNWESRKIT